MANKPGEANFFPDVPEFPSMGVFQPIYGKFDLTTYIQGASDYEIMAFLVGKYNACLEAYGNITKLSTDTITACKQLQDWINSWFTNLDVQEEINKKLDKMVADGSFSTLLHQTFDAQINQQTTSAVTKWLVANVTPTGSAVIVDKSLTIEGAAADAKETGKRVGPVDYFTANKKPSAPYDDCNTLPVNSQVSYTYEERPKNSPGYNWQGLMRILTVCGFNAPTLYTSQQLAFYENGVVCTRCFTGTSWTEWCFMYNGLISKYFVSEATAPYDDCNTLPNNATIWYNSYITLKNCPIANYFFRTIVTFNGYLLDDKSGSSQLAFGGDELWYRVKESNDYTNWTRLSGIIKYKYFTGKNTAPYDDCNTLPSNTNVWYTNAFPKNMPKQLHPEDEVARIVSFNGYTSGNSGNCQIAVYDKGVAFLRCFTKKEQWTDWSVVSDGTQYKYFTSEAPAPFNDCNTLPNNVKAWYANGVALDNCPASIYAFRIVICTNGYLPKDNSGGCQIVITPDSIYTRIFNGVWTEWTTYSTSQTEKTEVYHDLIKNKLSGFTNPVFYGDSITAGTGVPSGNDYPTKLCQKLNIATHNNYAVAGASYTGGGILNQLTNFNNNDIAIIAAGVNDCASNSNIKTLYDDVKNVCEYMNTNHPTIPVIFITPIKGGGYPLANFEKYINTITEAILANDDNNHFSIVAGYYFDFPGKDGKSELITKVFQGAENVHPTSYGINTIYVPALIQRLN